MTRNQVSEWFGNMRRRIREATRGFNVCWEERVRLYNSVITGKSEPLPILPGDSINTWVPPVSEEPPSLDQHEVSVSPKFKTTLLQRYLNNSYSDTQASSPSTTPPPEESSRYPHEHQDSSTGGEYSLAFSHPSPLRTSSPGEGFRALWNSSFEHVKDNRVPATEHRVKVHRSRLKGEEGDRGVRKYERHRNQNCVPPGFKRQKISTWSEGGHLHGSSSLLPSSPLLPGSRVGVGREEWRERVGPVRLQLPSWAARSTLSSVRFADEDGGINQGLRQPEELAAAYTLMQLQHM